MNEIHRYKVVKMLSDQGNKIGYEPHGPWIVMASDCDRVTAERDAALAELKTQTLRADAAVGDANEAERGVANWERKACESAERESSLQQRLTAADERVDLLEGLLRDSKETHACLAKDIAAERRYQTLPGWMAGAESDLKHMASKIDAALKPAEGGGDEMTDEDWQLKDDMDRYDDDEKEQP